MTSFEEIINRDGQLIYTNVGDSMQPLIRQDRDLLIIEKSEGRLKKYDVPLYKRDSGQYVLHRMYIARKLLKNGIINEDEYRIVDTNCRQKYQPVFGDIFSQNSLIKSEE